MTERALAARPAWLRPESALLPFAAAVFFFHQLPGLAGEPAGDVIDLLTPFVVIGAAVAGLLTLEARGPILAAALVAAILYVDGHGIHLSANSIANEGPGPEVEDLVHFWDETFSHIEAVLGWFGLIACLCLAERDRLREGAVADEGFSRAVVATALLMGWTFFTSTVEGGTWPIELAATVVFAVWLYRARRGPVLLAATSAYLLAALMIGGYAIWQGGVPQFSDAGLL